MLKVEHAVADHRRMGFSAAPIAEEAALPAGTTRAKFATGRFRVSADVFTGDRRLLDVIRDNTRQYLELRRMHVASPENIADVEGTAYADGLLNKAEIDWAAIIAEPSRAEGRLYGFVKKVPVRVMLVLTSVVVDGNVFVESSGTDPVSFFLSGVEKTGERFLAVGSATMRPASGPVEEAGLVIVNRSAVRVFSVVR